MPVNNTNTIIIIVVCCCILSIILSLGLYYYYYYVLTTPAPSVQTSSPTTQSFNKYPNTDISGNDIACYQSPNMTSNQCYNECVNDPNCVAYNNIPAGFNSTFVNQGCCKKNALTNTVARNGITLYTKNQ